MDGSYDKINLNVLHNTNAQSSSGLGRRRGHQHHIRYTGTRTSNIETDEILAALRKGDQIPITEKLQQQYEPPLHLDDNMSICEENTTDDKNFQSFYNDIAITHNNCIKNAETSTTEKYTVSTKDDSEAIGTLTSDIDLKITLKDFSSDPINSSTNDKSKSRRFKKNQANLLDSKSTAERHFKKFKEIPPMGERPPLEGADCDHWTENNSMDVENDPEAAEWSKLRCTSERTEVIAEREYRRQNRRCADYPGLAFGRSIFSSDTMMKLNIIRNELHNIMKTQLKRVRR